MVALNFDHILLRHVRFMHQEYESKAKIKTRNDTIFTVYMSIPGERKGTSLRARYGIYSQCNCPPFRVCPA
jgi:hypothetical protein